MSESIVTEKMKRSIYLDYPDYKDEAFTNNKRYGVYIPKLNDNVAEMIERHEAKNAKREELNRQSKLNMSKTQGSSPLFNSQRVNGTQGAAQAPNEDIFSQSVRANYCPICSTYGCQNQDHAQGYASQYECQSCKNHTKCCCKNKFRIRRSNSRPDSAYDRDDNTYKSMLHGHKYGYYMNEPYSMIGSNCLGSRFYRDHPTAASQGPVLSVPCTKGPKFESRLMTDSRTGQPIGQRSMNPVMNSILKESCKFRKNNAIQDGIMKLKDTGCLNVPCERIKSNKRTLEKGYVYNDYHSKQSKNGYARTVSGGEFN